MYEYEFVFQVISMSWNNFLIVYNYRLSSMFCFIFNLQLANQYWAPYSNIPRKSFEAKIIEDIYKKELLGTRYFLHVYLTAFLTGFRYCEWSFRFVGSFCPNNSPRYFIQVHEILQPKQLARYLIQISVLMFFACIDL